MNVHDAMVRKCKKVSIILDKKLREHRIEHDHRIFLDDRIPFDYPAHSIS